MTCRCSWVPASPCWCWSSPPPPTPWNTWLSVSKKNHNYKALFVLGGRNLNSKEEYEIAQEKSRYDDILLLPLFDSYGTLTNKVLKSLVFAHKHFQFDYLLKCDD